MLKLLKKIFAQRDSMQAETKASERPLISFEDIADFLPPDPVIVEAGAHIGVDSVNMSAFWPQSTIHAFEPVPELYEKLVINTAGCTNIHCYPYALGDFNSSADFYISSGDSDGSSSLLLPYQHLTEHPGVLFDACIRVQTMTLESWAAANNVTHVDFLWLDMQGCELHALKSAGLFLSTVRAIHTEVSLKEMYHDAPLYGEVRQWLSEQGFRVHMEALPWEDMGNVLFVRSSLSV